MESIHLNNRLNLLLNDLTTSGYHITTEQRIRVTGLFIELQLKNITSERSRLCNMLCAVLCCSAEEQKNFRSIFNYWFSTNLNGIVDDIEQDKQNAEIEKERIAFEEEARRRLLEAQMREVNRKLRAYMVIIFTIFSLSILLHYVVFPNFRISESSKKDIKIETKTDKETVDEHTRFQAWLSSIAGWLADIEQTLGPFTVLIIMVPLGLIAIFVVSSRKLLAAYARQVQILARADFRHLLSQGEFELNFVTNDFYQNVQPMRRQVEYLSSEVSVDATIEATIQAAGYFTPVYDKKRLSPEYYVFIDRRHQGDHVAQYCSTLINRLERAGVHVTKYFFDRDPRRAYLGTGQRALHFEDFAAIQQTNRMIMVTDGSGLFDMATGKLQSWAIWLSQWGNAILLTPRNIGEWGRPEMIIGSQLRIPVLPATEEGLIIAASYFDQENPTQTPALKQANQFNFNQDTLQNLFSVAAWRWVEEIEPPEHEVDDLMQKLRKELPSAAFDWLRSLAIYPAIYWQLSIFIGAKLAKVYNDSLFIKNYILIIARLPWLENGHMPDWFRNRLIMDMPQNLKDSVHKILEELLLTVVSRDPKDFAIEIGLEGSGIQSPLRKLDREELRRDRILVDFMTKREASSTDFKFSTKVANALGLPLIRSMFRNVFGSKELKMMRRTSENLVLFAQENNIEKASMEIQKVNSNELGPGVWVIESYTNEAGKNISLTQQLYLLKRNPNLDYSFLIDKYSLSLLKQRKDLFFSFSIWSMIGIGMLLSVLYWQFFDNSFTFTLSLFVIASIIYAPFLIFYFLILRPYSKTLAKFPRVSDR